MKVMASSGFPNLRTLHHEFSELIVLSKRWDQRLETATGTYPTREFAAGYQSFTDRLLGAQKQADAASYLVGSEFDTVANQLRSHHVQMTWSVQNTLNRMAERRETFKPYSGSLGANIPWGNLLDGMISDLQRGERLLYAKLLTSQPGVPATPNPGVPSTPTWPGAPRPTPLP